MATRTERINAGIALLDEKRGLQWVCDLDLTILNLVRGRRCVLGQLYGLYPTGCSALGLVESESAHGFFAAGSERWSTLTKAWVKKLTALRTERACP